MVEIDCIGLSCPIPLWRVNQAIAAHPHEPLLVKVDTEVSRENVERAAQYKGYAVKVSRKGDEIDMELTPKP